MSNRKSVEKEKEKRESGINSHMRWERPLRLRHFISLDMGLNQPTLPGVVVFSVWDWLADGERESNYVLSSLKEERNQVHVDKKAKRTIETIPTWYLAYFTGKQVQKCRNLQNFGGGLGANGCEKCVLQGQSRYLSINEEICPLIEFSIVGRPAASKTKTQRIFALVHWKKERRKIFW